MANAAAGIGKLNPIDNLNWTQGSVLALYLGSEVIDGLVNDIDKSVFGVFICWCICAWAYMVRVRRWGGLVLIHVLSSSYAVVVKAPLYV